MPVFTDVRFENNMIIFTAPTETTWDTIEKELEDRYVKGYKEDEWRWRDFKLEEKWQICVWRNHMFEDSDEDSDDEDNLCDCGFYHAEDDCPVDSDNEEEF